MKLTAKDLHTPFTGSATGILGSLMSRIQKILAVMQRRVDIQRTAVDATTTLWIATYDGTIRDLYAYAGETLGAGESMTIDVQKNGTTILTGILTLNSSSVLKTKQTFALDSAKTSFVEGDIFTVIRDYTVGGTPTPLVNTQVILEGS